MHKCSGPGCPCYECSGCKRRQVQRSKFLTHQMYGHCARSLSREQKDRDLARQDVRDPNLEMVRKVNKIRNQGRDRPMELGGVMELVSENSCDDGGTKDQDTLISILEVEENLTVDVKEEVEEDEEMFELVTSYGNQGVMQGVEEVYLHNKFKTEANSFEGLADVSSWMRAEEKDPLSIATEDSQGADKQYTPQCDECGKHFENLRYLKKHLKTHGDKVFECHECEAGFSQSKGLSAHTVHTHSGLKPFKCEECGAGFAAAQDLKRHIYTHTGERPFKCKECGAGFTRSWGLNNHMHKHSGEKPFKCEQCGAGFIMRQGLKRHLISHSGEKPFKCEECEARFSRIEALTIHTRTHTGEKPFSCQDCDARFTENGQLRKHMKQHTNKNSTDTSEPVNKPHKCEQCGAGFKVRQGLLRHMMTHSEEKPFCCEECGARFSLKCTLATHKRIHKGVKKQAAEDTSGELMAYPDDAKLDLT